MKTTTLLSLTLLALGGCSKPTPPVKPVQPVKPAKAANPALTFTAGEPTIDDPYVNFIVTVTRTLSQGRTLSIAAVSEPWLGDDEIRYKDELIQPGDRHIFFDCDAIADKIIDTNLVREITPLCPEGHDFAHKYWKQHHYVPDEFVDGQGRHWRRVKP